MKKSKARIKVEKKKRVTMAISITTIILAFLFFLIKMYLEIDIDETKYTAEKTNYEAYSQEVETVLEESNKVSNVIEETTKSVVGISKLKNTGTSVLLDTSEDTLGLGSGVLVSSNGYILSNEHVTGEKYSNCYITLEDGKNYEGNVVWSETDLDLSIVKINAKNLNYITLGDSSKIKIGETVYAIGNPIGLEFRRTVTSGIISAKDRTIKIEEDNKTTYMSNLIQTDATINPGNSGGPLIYPNGEMIGINSVKITSAEGIGFAVPINVVKNVIKSFVETDNFEQATLGIYAYDSTTVKYMENPVVADSLIISDSKTEATRGIYIDKIIENGPAQKGGLKENDIITNIDEKSIETVNELREYIYSKKPGDEVTITIQRGNFEKEFNIILE